MYIIRYFSLGTGPTQVSRLEYFYFIYGYVYKTTCLVNNLIYVGKHKADTFEPEKYIGSGAELKKLIKLFGKENFICEMLAEASTENELRSLEED